MRFCGAVCAGLVLIAPVFLAPVLGLVEVPLSPTDSKNIEENYNQGWPLGRVLGVSETALITPHLRAISSSGALLGRLTACMEGIVPGLEADFNCGVRDDSKWGESLAGFSALRSWPLANAGCVSKSTEREVKMATKPEAAHKMAHELREMLKRASVGILEDAGTNIKELFDRPPVGGWDHSSGRYQRCRLERLSAVRFVPIKGARAQWYFLSGITNTDQLKDLPDKLRYYLNEWIGVDSTNRFVDPLPMKLRPWDGSDGKGSISEDVTKNRTKFATSFERWGGRVGLSAVQSMALEDSPALKLALEKSDVAAGQAEDALTASNIGILALPMALNVIPVALVADVSSIGLFVYTVMTDILTTIPFIIKGFELFLAGSKNFAAQEVYYTDSNGGAKTVSGRGGWIIAESWTTECHLGDLRRIGSIFITVGFTMLFLGILIEYQAQRLRTRWIADATGTLRNVLKADDLEADMRESYGLSPHMPSNPYLAEEEQEFLESQVKSFPPKSYSSGSSFTSSSTLENRLARLSGKSGPRNDKRRPTNSGQMRKRL